jgi:MYXO-CTERM domain-containing protein
MNRIATRASIAAAILLLSPAAAVAQNATDPAVTDDVAVTRDANDDDFPIGLLGLLGLAGLLGLKRRNDHVHVDTRRDTRP